jgi:hypothetical protein
MFIAVLPKGATTDPPADLYVLPVKCVLDVGVIMPSPNNCRIHNWDAVLLAAFNRYMLLPSSGQK